MPRKTMTKKRKRVSSRATKTGGTVGSTRGSNKLTTVRRVREYNPLYKNGTELKFVDASGVNQTADTTGAIIDCGLEGVGNGTAYNQRIGSKARVERIDFRFFAYIPSVGGDTSNVVRVVLFQMMNRETPTINGIIDNTNLGGFNTVSPYNDQQAGKFLILRDTTLYLSNTGKMVDGFHWIVNSGFNKDLMYSDISAAPKLTQGSIYALVLSDSALAPSPLYTVSTRVYYSDA